MPRRGSLHSKALGPFARKAVAWSRANGQCAGVTSPTIRRVRSDEALALKAVRLAALRDSPFAFGSSHASESERPDDEWAARAAAGAQGVDRVTFLALLNDQAVGLVGGFRPDAGGVVVELVSMWTAPEARRTGVARALVEAVLDWARSVSAASVDLWVTRGNAPAERFYDAMGFRATGDTQPLPSDPSQDEVRMTLHL